MLKWKCGIPGKPGSDWEGGIYKLTVTFTEDYPNVQKALTYSSNYKWQFILRTRKMSKNEL